MTDPTTTVAMLIGEKDRPAGPVLWRQFAYTSLAGAEHMARIAEGRIVAVHPDGGNVLVASRPEDLGRSFASLLVGKATERIGSSAVTGASPTL